MDLLLLMFIQIWKAEFSRHTKCVHGTIAGGQQFWKVQQLYFNPPQAKRKWIQIEFTRKSTLFVQVDKMGRLS